MCMAWPHFCFSSHSVHIRKINFRNAYAKHFSLTFFFPGIRMIGNRYFWSYNSLWYGFFFFSRRLSLILLLFSRSVMSDSLQQHGLQHARLPSPSPSPGACSNSCPLSQWCHPTISSSATPFSFCLQSFPAPGSFLVSQLFASGDQNMELQLQQKSLQWVFRVDFL